MKNASKFVPHTKNTQKDIASLRKYLSFLKSAVFYGDHHRLQRTFSNLNPCWWQRLYRGWAASFMNKIIWITLFQRINLNSSWRDQCWQNLWREMQQKKVEKRWQNYCHCCCGNGSPPNLKTRSGASLALPWSEWWKILQNWVFHASISWWTSGLEFLPLPPFPCRSMENPGLSFCHHRPNPNSGPDHQPWEPQQPLDLQICTFILADKHQDTEFSSQGTCWGHTNRSQPDFQWPEKQSCLFSNCFILQTNFPQC